MNIIKNASMKVKLFALSLPLIIAVILSVILASYKIDNTAKEVTELYYDKLYTINTNLINADRDFYQAMSAAAKYHEASAGFVYIPEEIVAAALDDFDKNVDQVAERTQTAIEIAKSVDELYTGTTNEDGSTYKEAAEGFERAFNDWQNTYSLRTGEGSWEDFMNSFEPAREYLDTMQEVTETWAEKTNADLTAKNKAANIAFIVVYLIVIVGLVIFVLLILRQITNSIGEVTVALDNLASGNLGHTFPDAKDMGRDELGKIHLASKNLSDKLSDIIGSTKDMAIQLSASGSELSNSADQASQASSQVSEAVGEISQGAVTQAESVETAARNTSDIGDNIDKINTVIASLSSKTEDMKAKCNETMETMRGLLAQNAEVVTSMKEIHSQISATNEAVKNIAEASQIITDISSQTNLLSLNASIEAARAGESGRGFAVVATEIGNLADQSGNAAVKISQIVKNLVEESEKSVATIEEMSVGFEKQNTQINSTGDDVKAMVSEVNAIADETEVISDQISDLNAAKESLVNIISELSAVSEENAASTQETNASMEELNATFNIISESAGQLRQLASDLQDKISFFTT